MKEQMNSVTPKTRKAALNRAATLLIQGEDQQRKRENLMSSQAQLQGRIAELQEQLRVQEKQIKELSARESVTTEQVDALAASHNLTQVEIAETKSRLLQKQIARLSRAGKQ